MGRPAKKEKTDQVRLPESFVRRLRRISSHLGKDAGDYVVERLASLLAKDEKQMLADMQKEQKEGGL